MQPTDQHQFRQLMAGVYDFYARDLSEFSLSVWWGAMRPYEFTEVKGALNRHVVDPDGGRFLPKPADVVRLLEGGREDAAALAWGKVMKALQGAWASESLVFDDPVIHAAIRDMGGWPLLAAITNDEVPFRQREFETRYRAYRGRDFDYPAVVAGTSDIHNARIGAALAPPKMIGDPEKCLLVKQRGTTKKAALPPMQAAVQGILERQP